MKKKRTPFGEYAFLKAKNLIVYPTDDEVKSLERPDTLCGVKTPENLNGLTMGQMTDIITNGTQNVLEIIKTILNVSEEDILREPYERVEGFLNFVTAESERISGLFKQIEVEHTIEEIQAGVDQLNFGIFGTIDWYARRMGIHDHDEVMDVCWMRIWQCALNDSKYNQYQKRYHDVITKNR